jgi:hypothetical protein
VSLVGVASNQTILLREIETRKISSEQLASETKSIYACIVMAESKCIQIGRTLEQGEGAQSLSEENWGALVALHQLLLREHHDFFIVTNHPCATPALRRLAPKYAMAARMWKYGAHQLLEILRKRLPESFEHLSSFIYFAYHLYALSLETVPAFLDMWAECLGDLARYRMAIVEDDSPTRLAWAQTSQDWYTQVADREPSVGRLYHHLGGLARVCFGTVDIRRLFFYCRSLISCKILYVFPETMREVHELSRTLVSIRCL